MTRDEAAAIATKSLRALEAQGLGEGLEIAPDMTLERDVGWAFFHGAGYGWGPIIVTRRGVVYVSGSAFPPETLLEDVRVMSGATANPLRVLRYLWRRLTDGRTPKRFTPERAHVG
ncbi:MAG: hypothetical protein WKG00_09535 [Polyangiaceae bacterium]